jgi:hypothetical protein
MVGRLVTTRVDSLLQLGQFIAWPGVMGLGRLGQVAGDQWLREASG